ncbi:MULTISPECIES: hypothetical protein [Haloferax]|uniref:Uncharacterized protein n=1 Tax=Haloferax marinum TaxID=2666143 RepID=A0A6A8G7U0_9EURY|nr:MULTISPECIES: hypothetical protein [Haloferax]KAB1198132.1 hypothetical protein Hfx1150_11615 [Haloferax sp. CBA1150]MRW97209.1 hypothetical protein [Haloferax marinum]
MTIHPDKDSSDETDGKYSTEEKMSFDNLLKASIRERADNQESLDNLVEKSRSAVTSQQPSEEPQAPKEQQREESASIKRQALSDGIGDAYTSDRPSLSLAAGETFRVGLHTTYELIRTTVDEDTYYAVIQVTDRSYARHDGVVSVRDFGADWGYSTLDVDDELLEDAISRQRKEDLREGREPVDWLTEEQYQAIQTWYRDRVESSLLLLEDYPRRHTKEVHVFDQFFVVDGNEAMGRLGMSLRSLSDRQTQVILTALSRLVWAQTDLPTQLRRHVRETIKFPLLALITFDGRD